MTKAVETSQFLNWICKKYFRYIFIGALSTCAFFNLALHSASGLYFYCQDECMDTFIRHPLSGLDNDVIHYIKKYYVDPPHPKGSYKHDFPLDNPPWKALGKWGEAHSFIINYFKGYTHEGKFIEIGAQDGEFMSFSLWMEQEKGFTGLLIEPNPVDYPKLRAKGRAAYSINACASTIPSHNKVVLQLFPSFYFINIQCWTILLNKYDDILWLRDIPDNLPPLLRRVQEGSNRLIQYVTSEDRELGKEVKVQCFNVGAMAVAALDSLIIDFMSISTHGGEIDILLNIPTAVHIRMLVVVVPLATPSEMDDIKQLTTKRGLVRANNSGNIHIFIPKEEVVYQ